MSRQRYLLPLIILASLAQYAYARSDQFTPVVASAFTPEARPFQGTDGKVHIVYELIVGNASPTPATLQKIEVLDASDPSNALASYSGKELLLRLRTMGATAIESPTIEFNGTRLFLIDLSLDPSTAVPDRLLHHFEVLAAATPTRKPTEPVPLSYTVAPLEISRKLPVIGPPLAGKGWLATNGCCSAVGVHRASSLAVNGKIYFAQRFAIDWMQMDKAGRLVAGDPSDVHNYTCYGADVLAVADGRVVETINDLDDQKPGTLPDPRTINIRNVDGNHVVLELGDGVFAFYAHLQKGSVTVTEGSQVKRGQVLGNLGNTGNTSAPHLHFHLMEGPSVLGSNGIPYVIDAFDLAGQVSVADFDAAPGVEGDWGKGLSPTPSPRKLQFPLDLNIVNFSSGN